MKRRLLLLLTCLLALTVGAERINEQQALEKAQQFMQGKVLNTAQQPRHVRRAMASSELQNLYIFNVEDNGGFVIVSGDDRTDAILGYSTTGCFDDQNIPENFRVWLQETEAEIESLSESIMPVSGDLQPSARRAATHAKINPLIITTWNQGNYGNDTNTDGVYNIHLPKIGNQYPCTGCVAVVGAQLMYYYKWPQTMTQSVPGYNSGSAADTHTDLPPIQFQWNKMKTSYVTNDPNTEAVNAVADLLLYSAYATQMSFGVNGSSGSTFILAQGLCDYFDYHPTSWKSVSRSNYSVSEWDALIYNELACGRPVVYSGSGNGGHAFICDGYDGAGMYHFNWGWGGSNDGYFKLQATNPYGSNGIGFIFDHSCIIGLQPSNWPDIDPGDMVATVSDVTVTGTDVTMNMWNNNNADCGFGLGIGELNSDGSVTPIDQTYTYFNNWDLPSGCCYMDMSFDFSSYNLSNGSHILVPISLLKDETEWKRCQPRKLYFEVNVTNGKKTIIVHPQTSLSATQFNYVGNLTVGRVQQVDVEVESLADDYSLPLYLFASTTDSKKLVYVAGSAIEGGSSDEVTFYFLPDQAGTWNLWVATDREGTNVIGQTTVQISEAHEANLDITSTIKNASDYVVRAENFTITVNVTNNGAYTYNDEILVELYKLTPGTGLGYWADSKRQNLQLAPSDKTSLQFTFDNLEDESSYFYYISYYSQGNAQSTGSYSYQFVYTPAKVRTVQDKANAKQFVGKYVNNSACPVYISAADAKVFSIYVDGDAGYYLACRSIGDKYYINVGDHVIIRTDSEKEVEIHVDKTYTGQSSIGFDDIYDSKAGDDLAAVKAGAGVTDGMYLYRLTNTAGLGFGFTSFTGTSIKEGQFFIACSKKPDGAGRLNMVWLDEYGNVESETTGIETIESNDADNGAIYNLQGIRIVKPQKGIYIQKGRKIVVK